MPDDTVQFVDTLIRLLGRITHPRFYESERGYQGTLVAELHREGGTRVWPGDAIIEQEYQKRAERHGIRRRPDIIIHRPTPEGADPREGNFAVFELKLNSTEGDAIQAFEALDEIVSVLAYELAIFMNIGSNETFATAYKGHYHERLHCLAVNHDNGQVTVTYNCFREKVLRSVTVQMPVGAKS